MSSSRPSLKRPVIEEEEKKIIVLSRIHIMYTHREFKYDA